MTQAGSFAPIDLNEVEEDDPANWLVSATPRQTSMNSQMMMDAWTEGPGSPTYSAAGSHMSARSSLAGDAWAPQFSSQDPTFAGATGPRARTGAVHSSLRNSTSRIPRFPGLLGSCMNLPTMSNG